ncbi:simple sugar transport system ATP-binding protein [Deinococcus metalli]|uniref:Simple sugar transport system ATP-binding protein n=1 Tax=Deinococcus metalli TaxID=1141878 RepID=A0A7W8KD08_9DEIO|nr:ATP-binding cassette domain-containing protein [Deinococcus metalli]MBB5375690.1 simple sugar transport system ATP-binding protein [Deinococcus metalli]GHF37750.1 sugar ABC transporter ATP-binding protein [Deinococcus metalli]
MTAPPDRSGTPAIEVAGASKYFGPVTSLKDINMTVYPGEVHCLLGDNGAGKSTLIKVLSGVHQPSEGEVRVGGQRAVLATPRAALELGIATVYQDLAMLPLMSIKRNFFLGREPTRRVLGLKVMDEATTTRVAQEEMRKIGIDVRDPDQPVGTLSGGERQCVAIARAVYFGAKVLILDEPTSALGVNQAAMVLKYVLQARARGLGVVFITHNVHHAWAVGDTFTILNRGRSYGTFTRDQTTREALLEMMAGGEALEELSVELSEIAHQDGLRPQAKA